MKGIVFLLLAPFQERDYIRFGIGFLKKNFNVYVFDFTAMFRPDYFLKNKHKVFNFSGYFSINSQREFSLQLNRLKINYACDFIDISWNSFFIRNKLRAKGIHISKFQNGLILEKKQPKLLSKFKFKILNPLKIKQLIFTIYKFLFPVKFFYSDSMFIGGTDKSDSIIPKYSKKILYGHSWDYDIYLKLSSEKLNSKKLISKPYALFLDVDMVHHPNYEFLGITPFVSEENYFSSLKQFFNDYKKISGKDVVIALHPRADYDLYSKYFKNFKVIIGQTAELIKDCELVFQHFSTAISMAFVFKKNFILITTDEIVDLNAIETIKRYSKFFLKNTINIDNYRKDDFIKEIESPINYIAYKKYISRFIRHPKSKEKLFWEIYTDYISKI